MTSSCNGQPRVENCPWHVGLRTSRWSVLSSLKRLNLTLRSPQRTLLYGDVYMIGLLRDACRRVRIEHQFKERTQKACPAQMQGEVHGAAASSQRSEHQTAATVAMGICDS